MPSFSGLVFVHTKLVMMIMMIMMAIVIMAITMTVSRTLKSAIKYIDQESLIIKIRKSHFEGYLCLIIAALLSSKLTIDYFSLTEAP